jgi:hypothetical protein
MFCSKCGTELPADAKFCPHCGAPTGVTTDPDPTPEPVKNPYKNGPDYYDPPKSSKTGCGTVLLVLFFVFALLSAIGNMISPSSSTSTAASSHPSTQSSGTHKSAYIYHNGDIVYSNQQTAVIKEPGEIATVIDAAKNKDEAALQAMLLQGRFYMIDKNTKMEIAEDSPYIKGYALVLIESGANINKHGYVSVSTISK